MARMFGTDGVRGVAVIAFRLKACDGAGIVWRISKFPQSVQAVAQAGAAPAFLIHSGIAHMIRVGLKPVFPEKLRILHLVIIKSAHFFFSPSRLF